MDYDEARLQHIVYNILSNALKFTSRGGKVIVHVQQVQEQEQAYLTALEATFASAATALKALCND